MSFWVSSSNNREVSVAIDNRNKLKNKSKIYDLARRKEEQYINDYIPAILLIWEGNMDAQYIGESSYLLKNSNIDCSDIQANKSACSHLWSFALRALNNSECGAIKGADTLLGHPLYATDSDTVIRYLDVNIERKRKLKTFNEVKKLEPESNDIFCDSFVDTYYPQRPVELESKSLYEFAQW